MKIKFVEFLIDKGADVNFESQSISSPLYKAANAGEDDLCRYLIEKGADVKAAIRAANDCNDKKTSAFLRKKL